MITGVSQSESGCQSSERGRGLISLSSLEKGIKGEITAITNHTP